MRVLRVFLRAIINCVGGQVIRPELACDNVAHLYERGVGDPGRVGSHVSYQADKALLPDLHAFVKPLRKLHRLLYGKPELARSLLLELRRDERRDGVALLLFGRDRRDDETLALYVRDEVARLLLVLYMDLGFLYVLAEVGSLYGLLFDSEKPRVEGGRLVRAEVCGDGPILRSDESLYIALSLYDESQRHGLHAARRQPATDLVPKQRADLIADYAVEQAAGLLRVNEVLVDLGRVAERFLNGALCDLVKEHAANLFAVLAPPLKLLFDVPAYGLALAVRVRRHIDRVGIFCGGLELLDYLFLAWNDLVARLEIVIKVDPDALLGEVFDVAHGCHNRVARTQVLVNRFSFGWRLNNNQRLCHNMNYPLKKERRAWRLFLSLIKQSTLAPALTPCQARLPRTRLKPANKALTRQLPYAVKHLQFQKGAHQLARPQARACD